MCLKFIHLLSNEALINIKDVNVGIYKDCVNHTYTFNRFIEVVWLNLKKEDAVRRSRVSGIYVQSSSGFGRHVN